LRRVYVKDAEAESEISAALVKWAYTTCRRAEEIVAERAKALRIGVHHANAVVWGPV
jgi:hypothetical protein